MSNQRHDRDEFAADELDARQHKAESENRAVPPPGDGIIPDGAYNRYEDIYESLAQYTMVPPPDDDSIASMTES